MSSERPLDSDCVAECHRLWSTKLERYAWAILRDWSLAADAVQASFIALARYGGDVEPLARRAWLFKVVHREAVRLRMSEDRQQSVEQSAVRENNSHYDIQPLNRLTQAEDTQFILSRIEALPPEQQQVLQMRIMQEKTFGEIAEILQIPLGTALSRMRLALSRLQKDTDLNPPQ